MRAGIRRIAVAAACAFAAAQALAQTDGSTTSATDEPIEEIVVEGIRSSLADALQMKRSSDLVVEAISSDNIGQLPDITIAESLIRLPGINGARDRGNEARRSSAAWARGSYSVS